MLYYNPLCNFANGVVHDEDLSEDIVQDVFLLIWKNDHTLSEEKNIKSYLFTSVRNKCLEWIRKDQAYQKRIAEWNKGQQGSEGRLDEQEWEDWVKIDRIYSSLRQLPPKCREVFVLAKVNGLTYTQISETLKISTKTVEHHMAKAFAILRNKLSET